MTNILNKFSQLQKEALLGKLDVMKDAENFDKSFKQVYKDNSLVKQAVNQVALEKFAEMIAENHIEDTKSELKFANAKQLVDNDILKDIFSVNKTSSANMDELVKKAVSEIQTEALVKEAASIPGWNKLTAKLGPKFNKLFSHGIDDNAVAELEKALGAENASAILGLHGNKEGADILYDRIKNEFGKRIKAQASESNGRIRNPIDKKFIEDLMGGVPDVSRPVMDKAFKEVVTDAGKPKIPISSPEQIADLIRSRLSNAELNRNVKDTRNFNKLMAALGLGGATGLGYLGTKIPEYLESTDTRSSKYPSRGDLEQYLLGATTGAGTGLGLNYLSQGLGTGDWNPANMDLSKALLAAGVGGVTGAATSPLFPSFKDLKK